LHPISPIGLLASYTT